MAEDKQQPGRHWSKDFVEHLRTVHFALIAVCVGAIILASARTQLEISQAHEQLNQISDTVKTWDEHLLLAPAAANETQAVSNRHILAIEMPQGTVNLNVRFVGPNSFVRLNNDTVKQAVPKRPQDKFVLSPVIAVPESLSGFQKIWDSLHSGATINVPSGLPSRCLFHEGKFSELEEVPCKWLQPTSEIQTVDVDFKLANTAQTVVAGAESLRENLGFDIQDFDYFYTLYSWPKSLEGVRIVLPVKDVTAHPFDAEATLVNKHSGWHRGSFDREFAQLTTIAKEYMNVDLDTAEKIIAAEERRSAGSLDAFGLKFPAEEAVRWGIGAIVIVVVQLYLWAHLYEFRRKLGPSDEGWNVAWMGVYQTRPARLMLYASMLLFPLAGIVALGIRGLYIGHFGWPSRLVLTTTAIITLALSLLICKALPSRRELIKDAQPDTQKDTAKA